MNVFHCQERRGQEPCSCDDRRPGGRGQDCGREHDCGCHHHNCSPPPPPPACCMPCPGPMGPMGPTGPTGPTGPAGSASMTGATGPMGPQGPRGPMGPTGPQGVQGIQGVPGPLGPTGPEGVQGIQGVPGPAGPTGATGPTGAAGPAGATGAAGATGTADTITVGTTTVGATAAVIDTTGSPNHVLDFVLPAAVSVVPFASGGTVSLTTGAAGEAGQPCLLGFGSFVQLPSPLTAALAPGAEVSAYAFPLPSAATLTGVAASFRSGFPLSLSGTVLTVSALVFAAQPGDSSFTPLPQTAVSLSPAATGEVPAGQTFSAVSGPISVSLPAGTRLLLVFYASASGSDPAQIISGQASASIAVS